MLARIRTFWRALSRRRDFERDLADELAFHVEQRASDLERRGLPRIEAVRRARVELGAVEARKEECRSSMGLRMADELKQDLRYAFRVLRRSPGFTAVAAISLALGIGANTVVFSVLNALVLRPLPVPEPDRVWFVQRARAPNQSYPNYRDMRDRATTFSGLAACRVAPMGLETESGARRVWGYLASGNYFETLGIQPALGRFFRPDEDRAAGASPYAVLSYAAWQTRFGGDRAIVGRSIRINTMPFTVIGVAPRGFQGTEVFMWPEVWVPMSMQPQIESYAWLEERNAQNTWVFGRLKSGVTTRQAEAELAAMAASLAREHPRLNDGMQLRLSRPGLVGDTLRGPVRAFTSGVMALAALVLLAACANLANLLASRAADRHRELAVRQSIGAGRARILRQLLTESLVIGGLGGVGGCGLAIVLLRLLNQWRAPLDFPVQFAVGPDVRVLAFTATVSLLSGVLFGIAPARQVWKTDPNRALKGGPAQPGRRWTIRDLLLALQVATCVVLLMGSAVAVRGLYSALSTPLGFEPRGAVGASFDLGLARYKMAEGRVLQRRAVEAALQIPGVTAAAYANSTPLSIDLSTTTVFREGDTEFRMSKGTPAVSYRVSPAYFRTIGTRLLAGREFDWHDHQHAPARAIVNETFARLVIGARDAVGRRFLMGEGRPVEVVGVVEDGKYETLVEARRPAVYFSGLQMYNGTTVLLVRTAASETATVGELRRLIAKLDSSLPIYGAGSLEQLLGFAFFPTRAATIALGAFGLLAVMLAVTGIYGMASYAVSRRVREIGVRVAIGASPRQVLGFLFARLASLLAIGSAAGIGLGLAGGQALSGIVYQATPRDPVVLAAVPIAMGLIGLAALYAPARKVLSVDPLNALRSE